MTTIAEPHLSVRFQAATLAAHCKMLAAGMRNSRLPGKAILAKVTQLTGQKYKRGQYQSAIADLTKILEAYAITGRSTNNAVSRDTD
jgi:hypothetical protein